MKPPADLPTLRAFFDTIDWPRMEAEVAAEARARLAIVGPVNSGKSTLFNLLKGRPLSEVSAVPGTTRAAVVEHFGPFTLVDTPGFGEVAGQDRGRLAREEIRRASLVVLVLDAAAGLRQPDLDLYFSIRETGAPVVVALNKIDLVKRELPQILRDAAFRLQAAGSAVRVMPISARTGEGVIGQLLPAVIQASDSTAVLVGRALPEFRAAASQRVVNSTTWWALLLGAEPIPGLDLPLLLGMQARMVLRLAAIHGETFSAHHARELITTMAGGLLTRYLGLELAKFVPGLGWVVAGIVAALGTQAIGRAAQAYFASGHQLTPEQLRSLYRRLWRRPGRAAPTPPAG